jgi:hypothetical protein
VPNVPAPAYIGPKESALNGSTLESFPAPNRTPELEIRGRGCKAKVEEAG